MYPGRKKKSTVEPPSEEASPQRVVYESEIVDVRFVMDVPDPNKTPTDGPTPDFPASDTLEAAHLDTVREESTHSASTQRSVESLSRHSEAFHATEPPEPAAAVASEEHEEARRSEEEATDFKIDTASQALAPGGALKAGDDVHDMLDVLLAETAKAMHRRHQHRIGAVEDMLAETMGNNVKASATDEVVKSTVSKQRRKQRVDSDEVVCLDVVLYL